MENNLDAIVTSFVLTVLMYCFVPLILKYSWIKNKQPDNKKVMTVLVINSAVVWLIFRILGSTTNGGAAFLFYFVNLWLVGIKKPKKEKAGKGRNLEKKITRTADGKTFYEVKKSRD